VGDSGKVERSWEERDKRVLFRLRAEQGQRSDVGEYGLEEGMEVSVGLCEG